MALQTRQILRVFAARRLWFNRKTLLLKPQPPWGRSPALCSQGRYGSFNFLSVFLEFGVSLFIPDNPAKFRVKARQIGRESLQVWGWGRGAGGDLSPFPSPASPGRGGERAEGGAEWRDIGAREAQGRGSTHAARSGGGRRPGCSARGPFPRSRGRTRGNRLPHGPGRPLPSSFPAGPSVSGWDEEPGLSLPPSAPLSVFERETRSDGPGAAPGRVSGAGLPSPPPRRVTAAPRPPARAARRPPRPGRAPPSVFPWHRSWRPRGRAGQGGWGWRGLLVAVGLAAPAWKSTWIYLVVVC